MHVGVSYQLESPMEEWPNLAADSKATQPESFLEDDLVSLPILIVIKL